MITVAGTVGVVGGALWLFPTGHLFAGTLICTIFVLLDMLDGVLARVKGTSGAWGAFLDSTLDRIGDAAVFSGLAIWLCSAGTTRCWPASRCSAWSRARWCRTPRPGPRGWAALRRGLAERTERLLIALVAAGLTGLGVPYVLPIGLWALAAGSAVTFGQRVLAVYRAARARRRGSGAGQQER